MSSPWSSGADANSIWNSNSPNLNLLRRYSLRSSSTTTTTTNATKSTCSWDQSADGKYLVGYIVISRQDLELYNAALGFQLCGGKPTQDGQYGAIVEHVVPGSLINIVCKLKVGDEIVEWNGFNLRNKRNDEVCDIIESVKNTDSLRLVAIRLLNTSANTSNNNNNNNGSTCNNTSSNNGNTNSSNSSAGNNNSGQTNNYTCGSCNSSQSVGSAAVQTSSTASAAGNPSGSVNCGCCGANSAVASQAALNCGGSNCANVVSSSSCSSSSNLNSSLNSCSSRNN